MSHDAVDLENVPVSAEEAQAEIEIVLRSPPFDRSERLHKFLRYICELTLRGEASRINEYLIGSKILLEGSRVQSQRRFGGPPPGSRTAEEAARLLCR